MEYIQQIKISDCVLRNGFDLFDIVIFEPEFSKFNIKNVILTIKDSNNSESNILDSNHYKIYGGSSLLQDEKLQLNTNLFVNNDIPFKLSYYHKIIVCILNLTEEIVKQILDYTIEFKWYESNQLFIPNNFLGGYRMKWNVNSVYKIELEPNDNSDLNLIFASGMLGLDKRVESYEENYDEDKKYYYYFDSLEKIKLLNLSNIPPYENSNQIYINEQINIYSEEKLLNYLTCNLTKLNLKNVVSETLKIPIQPIKLIQNELNDYESDNYLTWTSSPDAISNIYLLCDNTKYLIKNIILTLKTTKTSYRDDNPLNNNRNNIFIDSKEEIFDLEFNLIDSGYKIAGLSSFLVIPTVGSFSIKLKIIFNTKYPILNPFEELNSDNIDKLLPNDFWIKFDRYVFDAKPRMELAKNLNNYSEYPVADLVEYCFDSI